MVRSLVVLLAVTSSAAAAPLVSSVTRRVPDPAVVVVSESVGATPVERRRAHASGSVDSDQRLVVLVELPAVNSPDVVTVTSARRDGNAIAIALESRRYTGPLAANEVTTPVIEVALGRLPAGRYTVTVDEQRREFATYAHPEQAGPPQPLAWGRHVIDVATGKSPAPASAGGSLAATVTRVPPPPALVIVPASAGATPEQRSYAGARGPLPADQPLVALIRPARLNSPDTLVVAAAHRTGTQIAIALASRRFRGVLTVNIATDPLVEVELGRLPPGTYHLVVREEVRDFTDVPAHAGPPHTGLRAEATLTVGRVTP